MKKLILSAILLFTIATISMAADSKDNSRVKVALLKDFPAASDISFKTKDAYTVASFTWGGQQIEVFYDETGDKIATSRHISLETLPAATINTIQQKYRDYTVTEIIEMTDAGKTRSFYVSLGNTAQRLVLHIENNGDMSIFKKTQL